MFIFIEASSHNGPLKAENMISPEDGIVDAVVDIVGFERSIRLLIQIQDAVTMRGEAVHLVRRDKVVTNQLSAILERTTGCHELTPIEDLERVN